MGDSPGPDHGALVVYCSESLHGFNVYLYDAETQRAMRTAFPLGHPDQEYLAIDPLPAWYRIGQRRVFAAVWLKLPPHRYMVRHVGERGFVKVVAGEIAELDLVRPDSPPTTTDSTSQPTGAIELPAGRALPPAPRDET
jgi:hypothetical protein